MKAKLWQCQTRHKNPRYWGERDEITINAPTIETALRRANKILMPGHKIIEIEWIATED